MGSINLRSYHRKIDDFIENNEIDLALNHCRYILINYPKNFRTHQLLSKAFLNLQDLTTADKVFDIILSVDPDDFVAHIGKSMSAEASHMFPDALEHMKRAFEIEPSNEGLQSEIKRLFEKNDFVSPNNVVLTRGALIKMYLRGKLYEQAIAEIKIGLHESPYRTDYKLALADCYYQAGYLVQAVESSIDVLNQLPYCLKANEILHKIYGLNTDNPSSDIHLSRLIELDPYYAFEMPTTRSILDVPDIAVLIEEYDVEKFSLPKENWMEILEENWNSTDNLEKTQFEISSLSWDSIIKQSLELINEDTINGFNIDPNIPVVPTENSDYDETEFLESGISKKVTFIHRLRRPVVESINPQEDANDQLDLKKEIDREEFDMLIQEDDFSEELNHSLNDETTDLQTLISSSTDSEWVSDENEGEVRKIEKINHMEMPDQQIDSNNKFNDTQPITTSYRSTEEMIEKALKAIEGENYRYAMDLFHSLAKQESELGNLSANLEVITERYPNKVEFLLLLGEIYIRLDEKQKALETFHKAQQLISF